ncbi:MAG: TerD family protein [Muribaculaceae bacterium]|nr:TerD family protein [Muribaculaceae bacterium]
MAINLVKGQRVEIGLSKLIVEMGWRVNPNAKPPYDLDASTFLLRADGQIGVEEDFVFYGSNKTIETPDGKRPVSADGSVLGSVDDLGDDEDNTGEGNEEIEIDLSKTNPLIKEIIFTASLYWHPSDEHTFYTDEETGQKYPNKPRMKYNFGQVRNAYILIKNAVTGEEICRYDLDEDFSTEKGVEFGRLYRRNGAWKFEAVGIPYTDGLEPICRKYASKFM